MTGGHLLGFSGKTCDTDMAISTSPSLLAVPLFFLMVPREENSLTHTKCLQENAGTDLQPSVAILCCRVLL